MFDFLRVIPKKRKVRIKGKKGIIYNNPPIYKKLIFYSANLFITVSLVYLVYLYQPLGSALYKYYIYRQKPVEQVPVPTVTPYPTAQPVVEPDDFGIQIPKILAGAKIVPNVSAFNETEYGEVLENDDVAHAKGSALPGTGNGKTVYIFAHSTHQGINMVRRNAVFYLLGELQAGDPIFITYHGRVYTYRVYTERVVNASEVQYLQYADPDKEVLIMQTCWPIGTDWKRLLVFAEKV